ATSGTPRPWKWEGFTDAGTFEFAWYDGRGNVSLTPPPVAPLPEPLFHTTSLVILFPDDCSRVPPHASTWGLEAGKSTCAAPSDTPSAEPSSPDAQQTVTPRTAAS